MFSVSHFMFEKGCFLGNFYMMMKAVVLCHFRRKLM